MINQNVTIKNSQLQFLHAFKELKIASLLNKSGIRKTQGASAFKVFQFLLLLVFQEKNLYRFLVSKYMRTLLPKNTTSDILGSVIAETVKCQLQQWIASQASFIQALFGNLSWES